MTMRFKNLPVGSTFYFPANPNIFRHHPEGPYVKISPRKYRDDPQRMTIGKPYGIKETPITYTVGSSIVTIEAI